MPLPAFPRDIRLFPSTRSLAASTKPVGEFAFALLAANAREPLVHFLADLRLLCGGAELAQAGKSIAGVVCILDWIASAGKCEILAWNYSCGAFAVNFVMLILQCGGRVLHYSARP